MDRDASIEDWLEVDAAARRKALVNKIDSVCTVPASAQRIMAALHKTNTRVTELAEVVSTDAAIASQLLRVANSPFYGQARKVDTIKNAIIVVGLKELRSMVAAMAMLMAVESKHKLAVTILSWSVLSGMIAQMLAKELNNADPSSAFLCGLLCEIGALACISVDGEGYNSIWYEADGDLERRARLELDRYAITTEEIAHQMLERNQLPTAVTEAVGTVSTELPDKLSELARLTIFARRVAPALIAAGKTMDKQLLIQTIPPLAQWYFPHAVENDRFVELCIEAGVATQLKLR